MKKKDLIVKVGCEVEQCNISPVKMIASSGILVWDQRVTEYRVRGTKLQNPNLDLIQIRLNTQSVLDNIHSYV